MYLLLKLFEWIDSHYHLGGWIKLGVLALFVLGAFAKTAENKKRTASGSSADSGRRREANK
jgi:hypothetical protein